jgi:Tfp pilus assembly protein FimV
MKLITCSLGCISILFYQTCLAVSAEDSLKELLGASVVADQPSRQASIQRQSIQPLDNETLDMVIKRSWPGLPSREVWVRLAFVKINPEAFIGGNPNLLRPGASIKIPSREELRESFTHYQPKVAALFDLPAATQQPSEIETKIVSNPATWVRYP